MAKKTKEGIYVCPNCPKCGQMMDKVIAWTCTKCGGKTKK
jgi:ribosomal protein L37AE/L43A